MARATITVSFRNAGGKSATFVFFTGVKTVSFVRGDVTRHRETDDLLARVVDHEITSHGQDLLIMRDGMKSGCVIFLGNICLALAT